MTFKTFRKSLLIIPLALMLTACATRNKSHLSADVGFIDAKSLPTSSAGVNGVRLKAIQATALSLGAKGALAWRAQHLNQTLTQDASILDHIYDFNQLLLRHNVLPPVIVEANNDVKLSDSDTIHLANKVYKLVQPARFVTTPPTWRNYLWLSYTKPPVPSEGLLPTTQIEANVWNEYLKKGWKQGLGQANSIFKANQNRLRRDFAGMVLYKKLLVQKMVSAPMVAKANLGITGDSKELHVNDVVMRITDHSSLQTNSDKWQPFLTKD